MSYLISLMIADLPRTTFDRSSISEFGTDAVGDFPSILKDFAEVTEVVDSDQRGDMLVVTDFR